MYHILISITVIREVKGKHLSIYSEVQMLIGRLTLKMFPNIFMNVSNIIIGALSMIISVLLATTMLIIYNILANIVLL